MLKIIRSNISVIPTFKKGDKLVCANPMSTDNSIIEYVINRPVKTYIIKNKRFNQYIKLDKKKNKDDEVKFKLVNFIEEAEVFKTFKAVKEFYSQELHQDSDFDVIEVTE